MKAGEILSLLRKAYARGAASDWEAYGELITRAAEEIDPRQRRTALQGELLLCSCFVSQSVEDLLERYREAARLIPGRSCVLPTNAPLFGEFCSPFAICNPGPGRAEEHGRLLSEIVALHNRLTGGGLGTDTCYQAQLCYYRGDLAAARDLARRAMEEAHRNEQEIVLLCAADLLANIAVHDGDHSLWQFSRGYIRRVADGSVPSSQACWELAQVHSANLDIALGILQSIPKWMREGDFGAVSTESGFRIVDDKLRPGALPSAIAVQIQYLSYRQDPVAALNVADMAQKVYGIHSLVFDAYLDFFRAGCHIQLGNMKAVRQALERALRLIAPDELWMIAAVFAPPFGDLLYEIAAEIDPAAPEHIQKIGDGFWDKLRPIREHMIKDAPAELSTREREVAELLMQGKKNSEIADRLHISVRTVRSHLENIYRKNNVNRRAQLPEALERNAVEIAFWSKNP